MAVTVPGTDALKFTPSSTEFVSCAAPLVGPAVLANSDEGATVLAPPASANARGTAAYVSAAARPRLILRLVAPDVRRAPGIRSYARLALLTFNFGCFISPGLPPRNIDEVVHPAPAGVSAGASRVLNAVVTDYTAARPKKGAKVWTSNPNERAIRSQRANSNGYVAGHRWRSVGVQKG